MTDWRWHSVYTKNKRCLSEVQFTFMWQGSQLGRHWVKYSTVKLENQEVEVKNNTFKKKKVSTEIYFFIKTVKVWHTLKCWK